MVPSVVGETSTSAGSATDQVARDARVHIQFWPSLGMVEAFVPALYALRYRHPDSDIVVSGLSRDRHTLQVTIGVPLTGEDGAVLAALEISNDVIDNLTLFAPHFVGPPENSEAQAANRLPRRFSARSAPTPADAWIAAAAYGDE